MLAFRGVGGECIALGDAPSFAGALEQSSVVVDALYGTGLDRTIEGVAAEVIALCNDAPVARFSLDLPSGLDADTGKVHGLVFRAHHTVTFGHGKVGLMTPRGATVAGRLHVVGLGVPARSPGLEEPSAELVEMRDVRALLKGRSLAEYKHAAGHVGIFAGAPGKGGAAVLAALGALRAGAGLVTLAQRASTTGPPAALPPEVMTSPLDLARPDESLRSVLDGCRSLVLGPGFGTDDEGRTWTRAVLEAFDGPVVVDADALTLVAAGVPLRPPGTEFPRILTPHAGEAARLLATTAADIEGDRYGAVRALADRYQAVVLLKGKYTLVASSETRTVLVNSTGGPNMATAGSGDVLAGVIAALGCHQNALSAAMLGAFLHGAAGDRWAERHGDRGMMASELALGVPSVLHDVLHGFPTDAGASSSGLCLGVP
jgi:NAD(P)H-hydrate epimerase